MSKQQLGRPIKGTNYVSVVIPFRDMPNVSSKLDFDDYGKALTHDTSIFLGFMTVIHMSVKYPEYHNLRHDETSTDNMSIFTADGWKPCLFEDIFPQLEREALECLQYVKAHGHEMLKTIEELKKIAR